MTWLYVTLGVIAALAVIYLILIAPGKKKNINEYKSTLFAHRGLHNAQRAENSMSAFAAAVEKGYGIELDVRLSKDKKLVVFHDDTLTRVAKIEGRVDECTAEELGAMSLAGTADGVPLFEDVLKLVGGRVPLLVEIKEDAGKSEVSSAAAEALKSYTGPYIVESFNPLSLANARKHLPEATYGILSQNYYRYENYRKPLYFALGALLTNRICKPAFIAYDHRDYKSVSFRIAKHLFGAATFAWTVRSAEEEAAARAHGFDSVIFENYLP